ncbi:MAG TPA: hypothetical protein VJB66_02220 [Candidatus Nanoarchaeia archaeon]|nr:hypothetical protein [Candidatus Nanoarchaeia archaeon]
MKHTFSYRPIVRGDPLLPVLDIELHGVNGTFTSILDSGASVSLFPRKLGLLLGVDYSRRADNFAECAHGDQIPCWRTEALVKIMTEEFRIPVFCTNLDNEPLLGREGFFERFIITFDEVKKEFILETR